MTKKQNPDIIAVRAAWKALAGSTSRRMLRANMDFLWSYFISRPPDRPILDCEADND